MVATLSHKEHNKALPSSSDPGYTRDAIPTGILELKCDKPDAEAEDNVTVEDGLLQDTESISRPEMKEAIQWGQIPSIVLEPATDWSEHSEPLGNTKAADNKEWAAGAALKDDTAALKNDIVDEL